MNSHLNIFKTYTKENREVQLENDLTRAFAISMQEDSLFLNEVLKAILQNDFAEEFFSDENLTNKIQIYIQRRVSSEKDEAEDIKNIYAVSLSEHIMTEEHFWNQYHHEEYDPICDIVIKISDTLIVIEAKRDNVDCTAQLYNQAFNICKNADIPEDQLKDYVVPVDLNWEKLMGLAVNVRSFELATDNQNRFLKDFINLVRGHNFKWLPEPTISSISKGNKKAIERRLESVLLEMDKQKDFAKLEYSDRLGLSFPLPWANELLFSVDGESGDVIAAIYSGNTKAQGEYIFNHDPQLRDTIEIDGKKYPLNILYHIKFSNQGYITGLWFGKDTVKKEFYTKDNFLKYCGRNKKDQGEWDEVESLLDEHLDPKYNWRDECNWGSKIINTNRTQFNMSFGYEISIRIPFRILSSLDRTRSDLSGLIKIIKEIYEEFQTLYK
jgi:hypothetical protein